MKSISDLRFSCSLIPSTPRWDSTFCVLHRFTATSSLVSLCRISKTSPYRQLLSVRTRVRYSDGCPARRVSPASGGREEEEEREDALCFGITLMSNLESDFVVGCFFSVTVVAVVAAAAVAFV